MKPINHDWTMIESDHGDYYIIDRGEHDEDNHRKRRRHGVRDREASESSEAIRKQEGAD